MEKKLKIKMKNEELQEYLRFKHRGSFVPAKKGKGTTYSRKQKHKIKEEE